MKNSFFWFRRDLRLVDNAGLFHALSNNYPVIPVFIFDRDILDYLDNKYDYRVNFIYERLLQLKSELKKINSDILIIYDSPINAWKKILHNYEVADVYTNHDYEPYAIKRDHQVKELLREHGAEFYTFKDQVIFEKDEILNLSDLPYTVYTPYSKQWINRLTDTTTNWFPSEKNLNQLQKEINYSIPSLEEMGFIKTSSNINTSPDIELSIIKDYDKTRDFPGIKGTSKISVHLRFGTISIRQLVNQTKSINQTYLRELIWREFFMQILWNFPHVVKESFKKQYDRIEWDNNIENFERWKSGTTGFPIVDAGMRELNETGYMHNRVRMITASFLTKNLLIDWRWGESYFAEKLLDFDLAQNNGNWQWVAGTGCDAAPYFRIFNPEAQAEKFDPEKKYIQKWVTEINTPEYPLPMIQLSSSRERTLKAYKVALG